MPDNTNPELPRLSIKRDSNPPTRCREREDLPIPISDQTLRSGDVVISGEATVMNVEKI